MRASNLHACTPRYLYRDKKLFSQLRCWLWLVLSSAVDRYHRNLAYSAKGVGGENVGEESKVRRCMDLLERRWRPEGRPQEVGLEDSHLNLGSACERVTSPLWPSVFLQARLGIKPASPLSCPRMLWAHGILTVSSLSRDPREHPQRQQSTCAQALLEQPGHASAPTVLALSD